MQETVDVARGTQRRRRGSAPVDGETAAMTGPGDARVRQSAGRVAHSVPQPSRSVALRGDVGADVLLDITAAPWPAKATVTALVVALLNAAGRG